VKRLAAWLFAAAASATAVAQAPPPPTVPPALAATAPRPAGPPAAAPEVVTRPSHVTLTDMPPPRRFVTHHRTIIRGKSIAYTATAGETYIANLYGNPIARFFSFAYVKDGPADPSRPVLFVFNGGPGSSSLWLHMGAVGPRRLVLDQEVNPSSTPPFGIQDNPFSPLDVADLVFIDPIGTGFSQAVGEASNSDFYGVDEDADSVSRFIEAWLSENGRWNAPKYVMGESYGSVRAAVLPRALMGGPLYTGVMRGITLDGVVLLGITLEPPSPAHAAGEPDSGAGFALPSMAATAWYYRKIDRAGRSVGDLFAEVTRFGATDYADALERLAAGSLPDADKQRIAARLAGYTGIPADAWLRGSLVVSRQQFLRSLLVDRGLEAGNYDSRYTLPLAHSGNDPVSDDPAMGRYVPGFIAAFHQMLRDELGVRMKVPYNAITWATLNFNWRWSRLGPPVGRNYADELAVAMRRNPRLRVLAASGYYDMVTTAAAAESQLRRAALPSDRLTIRDYESGHMLYLGNTAAAFASDVRNLITGGDEFSRKRLARFSANVIARHYSPLAPPEPPPEPRLVPLQATTASCRRTRCSAVWSGALP
jgi:carboxypeptidase C (cathepsin A)